VDLKANENVNVNNVGWSEMRKQMLTKKLCKWQYINVHKNCKKVKCKCKQCGQIRNENANDHVNYNKVKCKCK
jgi:hypothetical protein